MTVPPSQLRELLTLISTFYSDAGDRPSIMPYKVSDPHQRVGVDVASDLTPRVHIYVDNVRISSIPSRGLHPHRLDLSTPQVGHLLNHVIQVFEAPERHVSEDALNHWREMIARRSARVDKAV